MTISTTPSTQDSSLTSSTSPVEKSGISGFFESVKNTTIRIWKSLCSLVLQMGQQTINFIINAYNKLVKRPQNPETPSNNSVHQDRKIGVSAKNENSMIPSMEVVQEDPETDVNAEDEVDMTACKEIIRKCGSERESTVRTMQKSLETASVKDEKKMTPSKEIVPKELETDVNAEDANGMTPLMKAMQEGNIVDVERLLNCEDIDVNATNNQGETALICASKVRRNEDLTACIAELVKKPGIDLTIADNDGKTALMYLSESFNIEGIKLLMKSGKNIAINAKDLMGNTALMTVTSFSRLAANDVIELLLNYKGIDLTIINKEGNTALINYMSTNSNIKCFEPLIEQSVDCINVKNIYGETALMLAATHRPCAVELLLEVQGIDPDLKNIYDITALDIAKEECVVLKDNPIKEDFEKVVKLLEQFLEQRRK